MAMAKRLLIVGLLLAAGLSRAATVSTTVSGVDGELLANVRASVALVQAERLDDLSLWRLRQMADEARDEAARALRPFGYYSPRIQVRLIEPESEDSDAWRAEIAIEAGEPVTLDAVDIEFIGEGAEDPELIAWRNEFPLAEGDRLDHAAWRNALGQLGRIAEERGYFKSRFERRKILVDADRGTAQATIRFDTGPRYRFGEYRAPEQPFSERLMNRLHVLGDGEPYTVDRLDRQREVLVRAGLFNRVVVEPERDDDRERVDLNYQLEARPPNTWRTTVGFGTDTGARIQLGWTRHYLGAEGRRLELALGAQQQNREYVFQGNYRQPRGNSPGDFLTAGTVLRSEEDDFRFYGDDSIEPVFQSFDGRREQAEISLGRLQERAFWPERYQPMEERLFVSVLDESFDALRPGSFSEQNQALLEANPALRDFLTTDNQVVALGANWRLPRISGTGFNTTGELWEAQLIGAHDSLGSDVSFAQARLSGMWHWRFGERHKLLLRGEAGYTEADVERLDIRLGDTSLDLSLTDLPERYRFKTGGDRTVRGYGFEELSTNQNGSNHLLVGSIEYEYRVGDQWSLAAFADIGNAFNDIREPDLKRGVGVGFRWYTIIGPIQIDVAQALDAEDEPWRLHFTIGTNLL
jgi:translocation and assembly module TamA